MAIVQRRVGLIFAAFFALLVLAAARTLYLAALQGATLRKAARTQQLTLEAVPGQRGTITDRNGVDLAVSEPAQDISATPYLVHDPLAAARRLAPLLGRPQERLLRDLSQRGGFVYLARSVPASQARAALALKIPGVAGTPGMRPGDPRRGFAAPGLGGGWTQGHRPARPQDSPGPPPHRRAGGPPAGPR